MRRKPGRKPVFTEPDVIDAAFAIGVDRFTLSQVADRLGVAAAALYRLFDSRDEIVSACVKHAVSTMSAPDPGLGWRELLISLAEEYWRLCEHYPGLDRVLYSDPTAMAHFGATLRVWSEPLVALGRTPGQVLFASELIANTTMMAHARLEMFQKSTGDGTPATDQSFSYARVDPEVGAVRKWADRGTFELQLNFLLDSLAREWPDQTLHMAAEEQ